MTLFSFIYSWIDFLKNINYKNKLIKVIITFMLFFLLLRIISMFQFNINLNRCTDKGNSILWFIVYSIIILTFLSSDGSYNEDDNLGIITTDSN